MQQHETAARLWDERKNFYRALAQNGTRKRPDCYYDLQQYLTPVLTMAARQSGSRLLNELAEIAGLSYQNLRTFGEIRKMVDAGKASASEHVMSVKLSGGLSTTRTWFTETRKDNAPYYHEVYLHNFQYLFFICRLAHVVAKIPPQQRSPHMKAFLDTSSSFVTRDQLMRNIYRAKYRNWSDEPRVTGYRVLELKQRKQRRRRDGSKGPEYMNAILDREMWLIAATAEWLAANGNDSARVPLRPDVKQKLQEYVQLGSRLLQNRLTETELVNFQKKPVKGLIFDRGVWATHPGHRFAGYDGDQFPLDEGIKTATVSDVGWDVSHAERLPWVFVSLYRCKRYTRMSFPSKEVLQKLANQFAYAVFNGDFQKPLFKNFMDGGNGWYRVNYAGRNRFGYGPYRLSHTVILGARAQWAAYNPDVAHILDAVWQMNESEQADIAAHRTAYYDCPYWLQFASACSVME